MNDRDKYIEGRRRRKEHGTIDFEMQFDLVNDNKSLIRGYYDEALGNPFPKDIEMPAREKFAIREPVEKLPHVQSVCTPLGHPICGADSCLLPGNEINLVKNDYTVDRGVIDDVSFSVVDNPMTGFTDVKIHIQVKKKD